MPLNRAPRLLHRPERQRPQVSDEDVPARRRGAMKSGVIPFEKETPDSWPSCKALLDVWELSALRDLQNAIHLDVLERLPGARRPLHLDTHGARR